MFYNIYSIKSSIQMIYQIEFNIKNKNYILVINVRIIENVNRRIKHIRYYIFR